VCTHALEGADEEGAGTRGGIQQAQGGGFLLEVFEGSARVPRAMFGVAPNTFVAQINLCFGSVRRDAGRSNRDGCAPRNIIQQFAGGLLDDVIHDVARGVIDAAGFADFRFVLDGDAVAKGFDETVQLLFKRFKGGVTRHGAKCARENCGRQFPAH